MARFVDTFVYISKAVARHHQTQRRSNTNGVVIHNGIDIAAYHNRNTNGALRARYGLKKTDVLIGMIGRFEPWKGQRYFIEAMKDVATGYPNVKGLLIGGFDLNSGPRPGSIEFEYATSLKQLARHHRIEDKIIFTGYLNNMPAIISDLDIVVHASCTPEPFGLVIIEAMAAGKPVVATNAGGVPDIIQNDINGMLVPMRDADAMAHAILHLLADPAKVQRMGRSARKRVTDSFSNVRQVQALQTLYIRLLGRQRQSGLLTSDVKAL
jgi:glycosyltransferase involved in cell wall biosynthesis